MRKTISLVLAGLALVLLMGLGTALAQNEPVTITIVERKLVDAYEDNEILPELEARLGFKLNYLWKPSENYAAQCAILVASGDYPDLMEYWSSSYPNELTQMAEDGIILSPDELLSEYGQNILETYPKAQYFTMDGKVYGIPTRNCEIGMDSLFIIRKDWLERVGMETPATLDELYDVLVAFKTQDANGNGDATDEIPWGYAGSGVGTTNPLSLIATAFDVILDWNRVGDDLVYYIEMPEFKDALAYYRKLYQEGLIDPEYMVLTRDTYMEKKNADKFGVEGWWFTELDPAVSTWSSDFFAAVPNAGYDMIDWFDGPDGVASFGAGLQNQQAIIFSKSPHAKECVQLLDFLVSQEGNDLAVMGVEGVHWSEENGVITRNPYSDEEKKKIGFNMYKWLALRGYVPRSTAPEYLAFVENNVKATTWNVTYQPPEKAEYWTDLGKIFTSMRDKLITDPAIDFDAEFDNMIQIWKQNGGDIVTQAMNREYHADTAK